MTDFLFAMPSFFSGVGRVLDIGGRFDCYNSSPNGELADRRAAIADRLAVTNDARRASTNVELLNRTQALDSLLTAKELVQEKSVTPA